MPDPQPDSERIHAHRLAIARIWREKNRAKIRAYHRIYNNNWSKNNRAKTREWARAWRVANPCLAQRQGQASHARHREKHLEKSRLYYAEHQEELQKKARAKRAENPEIFQERDHLRAQTPRRKSQRSAASQLRRARKANAPTNDLTHAQWLEIQAAQDHRCAYCGKRCKGRLTQDHLTPLSQGGSHTLANMIGSCRSCNSRKGKRPAPVPVQPLLLTVAPAKKKAS